VTTAPAAPLLEVGRPHRGAPPMARILTFIAGQADKVQGRSFPTRGGPSGGYRRSGFGRTIGADAVLEYTQVTTVPFRG
jgi:acyl-CoA reductase-like NAD-dependent aldehyde dehydrogenase